MSTMMIGCERCPIRGTSREAVHCATCVVPFFGTLALPDPAELPLDERERRVVTIFATAGLISPSEASAARARFAPRAVRHATG
jgi:hypothetical protein